MNHLLVWKSEKKVEVSRVVKTVLNTFMLNTSEEFRSIYNDDSSFNSIDFSILSLIVWNYVFFLSMFLFIIIDQHEF